MSLSYLKKCIIEMLINKATFGDPFTLASLKVNQQRMSVLIGILGYQAERYSFFIELVFQRIHLPTHFLAKSSVFQNTIKALHLEKFHL